MKISTIAVALAMTFGAGAFAQTSTGNMPAKDGSTSAVTGDMGTSGKGSMHSSKMGKKHRAKHHAKQHAKHHAMHHASRHHGHTMASRSPEVNVNDSNRETRINEALEKFRRTHG